jgi:hypothetical protein
MEFLRHVVVLVHLTGFAILFGAWVVQAVSRRLEATRLMEWGLAIAGLAGLILAAPWPAGIELNYVKIGVKLVILLVIGALLGISRARHRRTGSTPPVMFWLIGILTFTNAAIAVLW